MSGLLPLHYNSQEAEEEFKRVMSNLSADVFAYLMGGCVRNALIKEFHGQILIQRDYDQIITQGTAIYKKFLESHGFLEHPYPSKQDVQDIYRKPLFGDPVKEDYHDWLVFDLHTVDGTTIEDNIKNNTAFTINGCAIKANDVLTKSWSEALIEGLPTAIQDIKDRLLRVNLDGYKSSPASFYAMLRFMSVGFSAPGPEEVNLLLDELPRLEHARFDRNVQKVWEYVGGEAKARELVQSLGITVDVFDEAEVKNKL